MSKLKKLLSKFDKEERRIIETLIERIISLNWRSLKVKKLKGYQDIFRVRKGKIRIIFAKEENNIFVFSIDRRSEDTYKF